MRTILFRKSVFTALACVLAGVSGFGYIAYSADQQYPVQDKAALPAQGDPLEVASNGYKLADYENFYKDWPQVAVRFREDSGEMRFTYANDLALKGLREGQGHYEDGAVFVKVGFMTLPDPGFASSISPFGARRYQLMVKDSKKHPETDGWGYALFNAHAEDGVPSGDNTDPQTCHACHKLVPERGFVFSVPMSMNPREPMSDLRLIRAGATAPRIEFYTESKKKLPEAVQKLVAGDWVRVLQGDLTVNAFDGTFEEVPPFLIREAVTRKLPTAFIVNKGSEHAYALIQPDPDLKDCKTKTDKAGVPLMRQIYLGEKRPLSTIRFCADNE
jgi:hypothetical protein